MWNKKVVLTEVGYRSMEGAHSAPWDWQAQKPYSGEEQANLYTALFSYWNNESDVAGVMMWQWETNPDTGGEGHTYYTPQHKPAEKVLTKWFKGNKK
jgi:hypothetical protein